MRPSNSSRKHSKKHSPFLKKPLRFPIPSSPAELTASESSTAVAPGAVGAPSGVGSCHNPLLLKPVAPLETGSGSLAAFCKQLLKAFRRQTYRTESAAINCNKAMTRVHDMSWKALADPIFSTCSGSSGSNKLQVLEGCSPILAADSQMP